MIILMTLLIAGGSMAFAVHQWWRGYHLIAIGLITFACLIAGVAIEAAKDNRNTVTPELLRQWGPAPTLKPSDERGVR
jgi:glucose uptake protein GlcU